jgi:hypothetical protein
MLAIPMIWRPSGPSGRLEVMRDIWHQLTVFGSSSKSTDFVNVNLFEKERPLT